MGVADDPVAIALQRVIDAELKKATSDGPVLRTCQRVLAALKAVYGEKPAVVRADMAAPNGETMTVEWYPEA